MSAPSEYAYIAVRQDGFVDGVCFTETEDTPCWLREMSEAGLSVKKYDRREAKRILFTNIIPPSVIAAFGLPSLGTYYDKQIPPWIETGDGRRWEYSGISGPQPDLESIPTGCCVIAPGLIYCMAADEPTAA